MPGEAQVEEIETLKSIYFPEELQVRGETSSSDLQIFAWAPVEVPDNYNVKYVATLGATKPSYFKVKHLPPIQLSLTLPQGYPASIPPRYSLRCEWLRTNQLHLLARALNRLWKKNKNSPIIYTWVEFLKANSLTELEIDHELDVTIQSEDFLKSVIERQDNVSESKIDENKLQSVNGESRNATKVPQYGRQSVVQILEAYDKEQRKADFMKEFHLCEICFSDKPGRDCMLFERCGHIFCRQCLREYFTVLINDGSCNGITCPAYKCETEVSQSQMKELLSSEIFEKYDKALLSAMLDTMSDIVYCPRTICQYPVTREAEEKVAVCPMCRFAFCIYCKMVYHGVEPCRFTDKEKLRLVKEYENASKEQKDLLEKRYGKTQLTNLVHNSLAEFWIKENSKNCPRCNCSIEKSEGCNKMTCWRCQTSFCWLCGMKLNPAEPYLHYRNPNSPCNEKLFHLVYDDNVEDFGWEFFVDEEDLEGDLEGDIEEEIFLEDLEDDAIAPEEEAEDHD